MVIRLQCPNGHQLRARPQQHGHQGVCPKCKAPVMVPLPAVTNVTDSTAMAIVGDYDPADKKRPALPGMLWRTCPRCQAPMLASSHVCNNCNLYLTS